MASVAAVAQECGVPNLHYDPTSEIEHWDNFSRFSLATQGEVARIRIRQRGERHPYSVLLTSSTRAKIEHYISRIRDMIDKSEMDLDRKKRLHEKLDLLSEELSNQRPGFAKVMAVIVAVAATMAAFTTIAADGRNAIAQIVQLIGQDKESEERATKRLTAPPKPLPSPAKTPSREISSGRYSNIDDDIPF